MFTFNNLRSLLQERPFKPFRLIRSDGGSVEVWSSEQVFPGRHWAVIGLLDPDARDTAWDNFSIVWYMHITGVEMLRPGAQPFTTPGEPPSGTPEPATGS